MTEQLTTPQPKEQFPLPEGYAFVDQTNITPDEIIELRRTVGWSADSHERWQRYLSQPQGVITGVRDEQGLLVGMGRTTADTEFAVLCDLAVRPEYQGRGIGKALVDSRVSTADQSGVLSLYTELETPNQLRETYEQLGFVATRGGMLRKSAASK